MDRGPTRRKRSMSGDATLPYGGMTRIRFEGYLSPDIARTPNVTAYRT
jgi:hypothetical protein